MNYQYRKPILCCDNCSRYFYSDNKLKDHQLQKHSEHIYQRYTCFKCSYVTYSENDYESHTLSEEHRKGSYNKLQFQNIIDVSILNALKYLRFTHQ